MKQRYLQKTFLKYTVIFQEGHKGSSSYLLQEGRVEISKDVEGRKKVLAVLTPISMFGEMALFLEDQRRTATAVALDDVKAVEIRRDDFEEFVLESPQIMQSVLNVMVHRLKSATTKSMRVPSTFSGLSLMIDLMARHDVTEIDYLRLVRTTTNAFICTKEQAEQYIASLAGINMVELLNREDGSRGVKIIEAKDFAAKAVKRMRALQEDPEA